LHVLVNETITTEIPNGSICKELIAALSTVIDKIKGQVLPTLGQHYGITTQGLSPSQIAPHISDFVFEYCPY